MDIAGCLLVILTLWTFFNGFVFNNDVKSERFDVIVLKEKVDVKLSNEISSDRFYRHLLIGFFVRWMTALGGFSG